MGEKMKLNNEELYNISGGSINWGAVFGIASGLSFIIGIMNGFLRLYRNCRG
jgi:lactobin A/cerein 7B family class IIb bacteriocin